ncbi:MAG: hypothetical protein ACM4D3_23460 [Candidatus Sericytochromatia bacterium]
MLPSDVASCCAGFSWLVPVVLVEVCAPPELRTTTGGLLLPGAVTETDVSEPDDVDVCVRVVADASAVDCCEPPELLTELDGAEPVSAVGDDAADDDSDSDSSLSFDVDDEVEVEVEESASLGSAHARPGTATEAPTPRAAASSPTRPMYPA